MTNKHIFFTEKFMTCYFILLGIGFSFLTLFLQRGFIIFLIFLTIIVAATNWNNRQINRSYVMIAGLFCLYILLSCLWSTDFFLSFIKALKISTITLCAVILFSYGNDIPRKYVKIFTVTAAISIFALAIIIGFEDYFKILHHFYPDKTIIHIVKPGSALLAICTFLLAIKFALERGYKSIFFAILTLLILLHPSITYTSVIAIMGGTIAFFLMKLMGSKSALLFSVGFIILILASPLLLAPNMLIHILDIGIDPGGSLLHRFAIWNFAIDNIWQAPIIGHGIGSSAFIEGGKNIISDSSLPQAFRELPSWLYLIDGKQAEIMPLHPHNMSLQLYLELGVIGIVFTLLIVFHFFKYANDTKNHLLLITFVALLVMNQSGFSFSQSWWMAFQILVVFAVKFSNKQIPANS